MIVKPLHVFIILVSGVFLYFSDSNAQDLNGYTNQYEIPYTNLSPSGSPDCNGSSEQNPSASNEYIIKDNGGWSQIDNTNYDYFFVCPDDYTFEGLIVITQSGVDSGGDNQPDFGWKHLICWYPGISSGRVPWNDAGNECIVDRIEWGDQSGGSQANHWAVHGMSFKPDHTSDSLQGIEVGDANGSNPDDEVENTLFDTILVDGSNQCNGNAGTCTGASNTRLIYINSGAENTTVQNSVVRNCLRRFDKDVEAISINNGAQGARVIANETYDCGTGIFHGVGLGSNPAPIIENNDVYSTTALYVDCDTGADDVNGNCQCGGRILNFKAAGNGASNPMRVIQNRAWGSRVTYGDCMESGGGRGNIIDFVFGAQYMIFHRNIIFDAEQGMREGRCSNANSTRHLDATLNIFHGFENFATAPDPADCNSGTSCGDGPGGDVCCGDEDPGIIRLAQNSGCTSHKSSYYDNTFSNATNDAAGVSGSNRDFEAKRNVWVNTAPPSASPTGPISHNVYVGTSGDFSETEKRDGLDSVNDFDQYCFYRKLLTSPELHCLSQVVPKDTISNDFKTYGSGATLDNSYGVDPN